MDKSRVEELIGELVSEFTVSPGCQAGDGMAASLKSIQVKTTAGNKITIVLKEIDKESVFDGVKEAEDNGSFVVENLVYSRLIPTLTEFAASRGVNVEIPTPKCYSTYSGTNSADNYICMEDLRPQGYKMADKYAGLRLDEMLIVVKELGHFHALSYALIKWEGEKVFTGEFSPLVEYFSHDHLQDVRNSKFIGFCATVQGSIENAVELLKGRNLTLYQRLKTHLEKNPSVESDPSIQFATGFNTDLKYFPVIIHGDAWQNNFLFKYNSEGIAEAVRFLDFQFTRRGNIYEELLYTVYTSTTPEFRRHHLLTVLHEYFESFGALLKALKIHWPIGFTFGTFVDTFLDNLPSIYRYMCFAIPLQLGTSIPEVMVMMENHSKETGGDVCAGAEDQTSAHDRNAQLLQIMRMQMETNSKAVDRLEALTQEMTDLRVF